ncbi:MAG: FAD-dependent oxidoreductase [Pseudonocardiaceae bacterium]
MTVSVVIVGGGYGGISVAKALDDVVDVVLVDPKDSFVHSVAALRGVVSKEWAERMFFGYERLLSRGRVVRDRVVKVDSRGVTTAGGQRIEADYVVLASGSSYPYPAKMDVDDTAEALVKQAMTREQLASASRVLLVGAGPVGLELAGEILDVWPDRTVTIVDVAEDILGGAYLPELRDSLHRQLDELGVRLVLGAPLVEEIAVVPGVSAPFSVSTTAGVEIDADIWFRCYGVVPQSDYLAGDLLSARRPDGFIDVDDRFRVAGHDNVFAIGDVTGIAEPKRASAAQRHAQVVADNIAAMAQGRLPEATYRPGPDGVLIPLGATGGAGQLPIAEATVVGPEQAAQFKGRDLMVGRYAQLFDGNTSPQRPEV